MSNYNFGGIDSLKRNREIEGVTGTPINLEGSGITIIVLAATDANPRWKTRRRKMRIELNRLTSVQAPEDQVREFLANEYANSVMKDWYYTDDNGEVHKEGIPDTDGNYIPFSTEAAKAFLIEADDAFAAVEAVIYDTQKFRGAHVEAVVKQGKS